MIAGGRRCLATVWVLVWASSGVCGQTLQKPPAQNLTPGVIAGTVVDAATGTPISRVSVLDERTGQSALTGADGRFELTVLPGTSRLRVSVVGFVLVRREVEVGAGNRVELTIALTGGTGTYSETVTVAGERFREQERSVPAQQTLGSGDIQNLRNLLTNDPMRAIQVLSGAATGDDLRSEFSIRGTDFSHLDFTVDGFSTPFILHTVRAVEDHSNSGSVAMINSDVLGGVVV